MEKWDREMERRVWARVMGRPGWDAGDLAAQALQRSNAYERLSRVIPGSRGKLLEELARQERENAQILRRLGGKRPLRVKPWPKEPPRALLERCSRSARQAQDAYEQLSAESAHFLPLRACQQTHCVTLTQLLERM